MPPESRLVYFLACDQARTETSNKSLYIGAYGPTLVVEGTFPAVLPSLVLVGCIQAVRKKETIKIVVRVPGTDPIEHDQQITSTSSLDAVTLNVTLSPCVLPKEGAIEVEYRFSDSTEIRTLNVISRQEYKKRAW